MGADMNLPPSAPSVVAWNSYRRRRAVCWTAWLAFGVYVGALAAHRTHLQPASFAAPVAVVLTGWWLRAWRCPRCGNRYFSAWSRFRIRRCAHCGLERYAAGP
jgi:hypothetical protein